MSLAGAKMTPRGWTKRLWLLAFSVGPYSRANRVIPQEE